MTETVSTGQPGLDSIATVALKRAATFWFLTAVIGQWFFAYYMMIYYGGSAVQGNWAAWTNRMIHGFIEGDLIGNIAVLIHISLAFVITFCGPLQIMLGAYLTGGGPFKNVPKVQAAARSFHHWNGRIYILTAFIISIAAIYMLWSREAVIGSVLGRIGTSLDGVLVIVFAAITVRHAIARRIKIHQRWALRLFIVVNGVWFFRVGRGLWMFLNDGASPGSNNTLTGSFDLFINFAGYLLPLFFLELYFRTQDHGGARTRFAMAGLIVVLTVAMGAGIYTAAQLFWLPVL